ncbi:MAG: hypothetical protein U0P81_13935 [Holophagaceae bacterium]
MTKLTLNRETLRALDGREASQVDGGATALCVTTHVTQACGSRFPACTPSVLNATCIRDLCL